MSVYLKKASKAATTGQEGIRNTVGEILDSIRNRGETAVREYNSTLQKNSTRREFYSIRCFIAAKFDNWKRDFILSEDEIQQLITSVPQQVKDDIDFAYDQVYGFALKQRESLLEFEAELYPGVILGSGWCHAIAPAVFPGGLFAHAASAIMSIATAKAAGVPFVVAASPSHDGHTINPAILYAVSICNPDVFMMMGATHAIAALAYGHFTGKPADVIVGPGNRFVAEAKRMLFGQIGIDVFAGPTETLVLADKTADPYIVAIDLMSQAEHGYDSPVWLVTDSKELGEKVLKLMPEVIADLPSPEVAQVSWRDYGEVVLCVDREEMAKVNDDYAAEHVQVMADDLDWWLKRLTNYGSLFLGEGCTVPYGDKTTGTNHILPTKKAARYSGGLSVGKFIKTVTYQKVSVAANRKIAAVASRISRLEGMEGHARAADVRLRKYYPGEKFDFEVYQPK